MEIQCCCRTHLACRHTNYICYYSYYAAGGYRPFGIEGWRMVFLTVGLISFALGILNYIFAHDPRYARDNKSVLEEHQHGMSFWGALSEMKKIITIPSFLIIILQVSDFVCCRRTWLQFANFFNVLAPSCDDAAAAATATAPTSNADTWSCCCCCCCCCSCIQ